MFIRKLFNIQKKDESDVYINKNSDNVIIISKRPNDIDHQSDIQSIDDGSNPKYVTLSMDNSNNDRSETRNDRLVELPFTQSNSAITTSLNITSQHLDPIIDYAQEELASLFEACVPLMHIIENLLIYVQLALRETPQQPPDDLTRDESAAIRLYTMEWDARHPSLYAMLNFTLKDPDREHLRPYHKYLKLLLTAVVKLPCAPMQTVWRGVNKNLSKDFPPETLVTWWSFSSCTASLPVLENQMYLGNTGERTLFSVEAINARIIRHHSHFNNEDEILLLPGTYMEVHSQLSPAPDLHIIHLKQIKPEKPLLGLPFYGALLYPPEKKKVPWYKKKRTIIEISLLIGLCIAGIIVGAVLGTRPSLISICYTRSTGIKADLFWSFDCGDAREDLQRADNGTNINDARYSSPDFSGQGKALNLDRKLNQYIQLPQSLNLTMNTSFTVSAWIFSTGYSEATIISDCNTMNSACITFSIESVMIYASTYNWNNPDFGYWIQYNARGVNYQSSWMHLTFLYDNENDALSIYVNGYYKTTNGFSPNRMAMGKANQTLPTYIGLGTTPNDSAPFDGLIDQLSISYYLKNDSEILDEATLLCSYTFDSDNVNDDSGPNHIQAYSENVNRSLSNNDSTLLFNSSDAYFQTSGFTLLMSTFYEFTIAFWFRPIFQTYDKLNSAMAILQFVSKVQQVSSESYVCFLSMLIANVSTDHPYIRFEYGQLNMFTDHDKRIIYNNTWTHIGITYSNASQVSIYYNGSEYYSFFDKRFSSLLYNPRLALTIGGNYFDDMMANKPTNSTLRKCFAENPEFNFTQMYGEVDDLKVYARALDSTEIATLADSKTKSFSSSSS